MTPGLFARDMAAFPVALFSGAEYSEVKEKALNFIRSTARVAFAVGVIWAMYKGQHCEMLRKLSIPVVLLSMKLSHISFSLEPLSVLTNLYLITTARSKLAVGAYLCVLGVFQTIAQTFHQWKVQDLPIFFSASLRRVTMKIDPFSALMNIALVKIPEARLGIGLYTLGFGIFQIAVYTTERWNLRDAPTSWALKGILHMTFGLGWLGIYERYSRHLEKSGTKKQTYFYRAADRLAPFLTWLATGKRGSIHNNRLL